MALLRYLVIGLLISSALAAEDVPSVVRRLTELAQSKDPGILDKAWPYLSSEASDIREAARKAVQTQPYAAWKDRALEEKETWASLVILRALTESCPPRESQRLSPHLCEQITTLRLEQMDEAQLLAALRLTRFVFEKLGPVSEDERHQMLDLWSGLPRPAAEAAENERQRLLEFLRSVTPRRP